VILDEQLDLGYSDVVGGEAHRSLDIARPCRPQDRPMLLDRPPEIAA